MTEETLSLLAYERIKSLNPQASPSLAGRLASMVPAALELLAERALREDSEGLQKDFAATPVAGRIDLTALSGLLFDLRKSKVRVAASNLALTPVDRVETLEQASLPLDQVFYTQDGAELVFRDTNGSTTAYVTPVKIKSVFIPTLATLPARYEGTLVSTLVEMSGMSSPEATERVAAA